MFIRSALIAALGSIALPAMADEVWSTNIGDVIYEADLETGEAVLSYPATDTEARGQVFIDGLAGNYTQRGAFSGIWIEADQTEGEGCDVSVADPSTGIAHNNWGRIEMIFTKPDFPGGFVMIRGNCFEEPSSYLIGTPVTAMD
ncbi:MAG: hypothetical protein ACRBEQ_03430 [Hyphomonas sp.]